MKKKCYYLSLDECAILQYIKENEEASFNDITLYLTLDRDKIEEMMEGLISKRLVGSIEIGDLGYEQYYDLEDHLFLESGKKKKKITIKKPFLWRTRSFFLRLFRKVQLKISIWNDLRKMEKDKWKRIKAAGLEKEFKEKEKWAKRILRSKSVGQIIEEIEKVGYIIDEEKRYDRLMLEDVFYKSIGIIAQNGEWGIETISGLPVLVGKECLNFVTPYNASFYFMK